MHSGHAGGSSHPGTGGAGLDGITPGESSPALLGGATLILLALPDVALTAPHVQSESPFCTRLNRLVWWLPVRVTRLAPDHTRDEVLGWALPLMLGSTMAAWALAYIVGFALVQLPFIRDPASFSLPGPRSNLETPCSSAAPAGGGNELSQARRLPILFATCKQCHRRIEANGLLSLVALEIAESQSVQPHMTASRRKDDGLLQVLKSAVSDTSHHTTGHDAPEQSPPGDTLQRRGHSAGQPSTPVQGSEKRPFSDVCSGRVSLWWGVSIPKSGSPVEWPPRAGFELRFVVCHVCGASG
jgi:hypothetical protein